MEFHHALTPDGQIKLMLVLRTGFEAVMAAPPAEDQSVLNSASTPTPAPAPAPAPSLSGIPTPTSSVTPTPHPMRRNPVDPKSKSRSTLDHGYKNRNNTQAITPTGPAGRSSKTPNSPTTTTEPLTPSTPTTLNAPPTPHTSSLTPRSRPTPTTTPPIPLRPPSIVPKSPKTHGWLLAPSTCRSFPLSTNVLHHIRSGYGSLNPAAPKEVSTTWTQALHVRRFMAVLGGAGAFSAPLHCPPVLKARFPGKFVAHFWVSGHVETKLAVLAVEGVARDAGVNLWRQPRRSDGPGEGVEDEVVASREQLARLKTLVQDKLPRFNIVVSRKPCGLCKRFVGRLAAVAGVRFEIHFAAPMELVVETTSRIKPVEVEKLGGAGKEDAQGGEERMAPPESQDVDVRWTEGDAEERVWFDESGGMAKQRQGQETFPRKVPQTPRPKPKGPRPQIVLPGPGGSSPSTTTTTTPIPTTTTTLTPPATTTTTTRPKPRLIRNLQDAQDAVRNGDACLVCNHPRGPDVLHQISCYLHFHELHDMRELASPLTPMPTPTTTTHAGNPGLEGGSQVGVGRKRPHGDEEEEEEEGTRRGASPSTRRRIQLNEGTPTKYPRIVPHPPTSHSHRRPQPSRIVNLITQGRTPQTPTGQEGPSRDKRIQDLGGDQSRALGKSRDSGASARSDSGLGSADDGVDLGLDEEGWQRDWVSVGDSD